MRLSWRYARDHYSATAHLMLWQGALPIHVGTVARTGERFYAYTLPRSELRITLLNTSSSPSTTEEEARTLLREHVRQCLRTREEEAIAVLGHQEGVGRPTLKLENDGAVRLVYDDGQEFEVRVTMTKRIGGAAVYACRVCGSADGLVGPPFLCAHCFALRDENGALRPAP